MVKPPPRRGIEANHFWSRLHFEYVKGASSPPTHLWISIRIVRAFTCLLTTRSSSSERNKQYLAYTLVQAQVAVAATAVREDSRRRFGGGKQMLLVVPGWTTCVALPFRVPRTQHRRTKYRKNLAVGLASPRMSNAMPARPTGAAITTASKVPSISSAPPPPPKREYPSWALPTTLVTLVFSRRSLAEIPRSSWKRQLRVAKTTDGWPRQGAKKAAVLRPGSRSHQHQQSVPAWFCV